MIITLKDNVPAVESYETLFPEVDISSVEVISEKFLVLILETQTKQSVVDAINELKDNAYVKAAEPNYLYELASLTPVIPNDPYYDSESEYYQQHLSHIEADTAWNYTTGSSNVKVGIIDTGADDVADLEDNLDLIKLARYLDYLVDLNDPTNTEVTPETADTRKLNEDQVMRADMNKDNVINELDSQALGQYLVQRSLNLEIQ